MNLRSPTRLAVLAALFCLATTSPLCAQGTLIDVPTRRDMVFDRAGNYLYITTSDGFVRRYHIATGVLEPGFNVGGSLNAIDVAGNDSFLLVAQSVAGATQGTFHRIDLSNGATTNINYTRTAAETGAWDLAIGSNNIALVTTQYSGSGTVPVRQIDLSTNTITSRPDAPTTRAGGTVAGKTSVVRNAGGTRLYLLEPSSFEGSVFTYDASTNAFGQNAPTDMPLRGDQRAPVGAVSPTGSVVATGLGSRAALDSALDFTYLRTAAEPLSGGIAFDATKDRFYFVTAPNAIVACDANTYRELYRLPFADDVREGPQQFGTGNLVASHDGRFLALATSSGIRLFTLPEDAAAPPPSALVFRFVSDMVFDHAGQRLYLATLNGLVWPYNLATRSFETPYHVGGSLQAVDIAFDDSYLLLAQGGYGIAQAAVQKLDLATGAVTNINYERTILEGGSVDVAIGSNGRALATTGSLGFEGGPTPLREINLATDAVSKRIDAPGSAPGGEVRDITDIHRSRDGTRLYLLEGFAPTGSNDGRHFTYSAASNNFGAPATGKYLFVADGAVNRDGSLLATQLFDDGVSLWTAPNFGFLHRFSALTASGVAFDAVSDTIYGTSPYLSQIIAYDTNTFAERFRFDVGENVVSSSGTNPLVASQDGRYLARLTWEGLRVYRVPAVQLVSASSLKTPAGSEFRVDLPLNGPAAPESRSGGPDGNYTMIFTFGQNLTSVGGATVTTGTGSVASSMIDGNDPRRYIVNLAGITDRQYVKVTLNKVLDALGSETDQISQQMGVLIGDTNGDRRVNSADVLQTRTRMGQATTAATFRSDVNSDGAINAADATIVRANSGGGLP